MSVSSTLETYTNKPVEKVHNVRFVGSINGCYSLSSRAKSADNAGQVFACRTQSISPSSGVLSAPVNGAVGETLYIKLEDFNIIKGTIVRLFPGGFEMHFDLSTDERTELAAKIGWVKKRRVRAVKDKRDQKRVNPPNPRSAITMSNGSVKECFVIDVSRTGVSVSADVRPPIGERVAIGKAIGVVVRQLDIGFAVHFDAILEMDQMDSVFGWALTYLGKEEHASADAKDASKAG